MQTPAFLRTVKPQPKPRILYKRKQKHKIWAQVMITLKNATSSNMTLYLHQKVYLSVQEDNVVEHSGIKCISWWVRIFYFHFFWSAAHRDIIITYNPAGGLVLN